MDSNYEDIIRPTLLLERVLKEEEFCHSNGLFKIQKIEASLKKAEESYLLSINEIHTLFANIISMANQWKNAALKEFEDAAKLQRHLIIHEKKKLQENLTKLKQIAFISQKELYNCEDPLKKDSIASLCLDELLPTMEPLIPTECAYDIDTVQFIVNAPFIKQFFHFNTWHKLCYIQHATLDIKSFSLECLEKNYTERNTEFYIKIPSRYDIDKVAPFITWQVVIANNEPLMTTRSVQAQSIKVEFLISKMDTYTISCYVFNQHISGSPCTIIPFSLNEGPVKSALSSVKVEDSPFPDKVNDVFENGTEDTSYTFEPCCSSSVISSVSQSRASVSPNFALPSSSFNFPTHNLSLPTRRPPASHGSTTVSDSLHSALHCSSSAPHNFSSTLSSSPSPPCSSSSAFTSHSASPSLVSAPPGFSSAPASILSSVAITLPSTSDSFPSAPRSFPLVAGSPPLTHKLPSVSNGLHSEPNSFPPLPNSSSSAFATVITTPPGFLSAPTTCLPSASASLTVTPHSFPLASAHLSAPPGFSSRKPVDRTTKIDKAPLRPPLRPPHRQPADTSIETSGEESALNSTQPHPPQSSPSSGKTDLEESLDKFAKMNLQTSNFAHMDDSSFMLALKASTPAKVTVKTEKLSNGHLCSSVNYFNNNIGEDNKNHPVNTVSSSSCNSSSLKKTYESITSLPATITLLQFKLFAKYNLVFTGNAHTQLHQPIGVAQLQNGSLVVADTFANRMLLLSSEGKFLHEFNAHPPLKQPSAVVVLKNGSLAVRDNRCLHTFSPSCQYITALGDNILKRPFGLSQDENGFLVTVDTGFGDVLIVVRLNPKTGKVISRIAVENAVSSLQKTMTKPRFIVCKPPATVLIVDLGLNTVYMVDIETGKMLKKFGQSGYGNGEFNDPSGIVCDADGFIMVGDSRNHRIQVFSPDGDFVCVLPVDRPLKRPSGLCLTQEGQLLVLNYWENSLVRYKLCIKD